MMEHLDYTKNDDRFRIAEFRTRVIMQVIALSLAANAVPIALGSLFPLGPFSSPPWNWFWYATGIGWIALASSILAGVIFITSAPNWAKDYTRGSVLNVTYVVCAGGLFLGAGAFAVATFLAIFSEAPT